MTQDEKNRKIAEWLGWTAEPFQSGTGIAYWHSPKCGAPIHMSPKCDFPTHSLTIPNFYTDEAANALVLDKMAHEGFMLELWPQVNDTRIIAIFRRVIPYTGKELGRGHLCPDRKTAICEASLQWIEQEKTITHASDRDPTYN